MQVVSPPATTADCPPVRSDKYHVNTRLITKMMQDWGNAQAEDIAGQLKGGIRYLDLRPVFCEEDLYLYHGLIGP